MPHDRFYVPSPLVEKALLELTEEESHHLTRVMRVRVGEPLEVVNGLGQLAQANLEVIGKRSASVRLQQVATEPPPSYRLILAQAIPRANRLDTIVEKSTELGMTDLWLFPGERSERRDVTPQQQTRIRHQAIAALKQCGRLRLPNIEIKPPLLQRSELPSTGYFGDLSPNAPRLQDAWEQGRPRQVICFIGPEAGFTPAEERHLREQLHATGVKLHPNILRTDTAPLAMLSLLSHWIL